MMLHPSDGRLLVASDDLLDPNFRHAVVLIMRYDPDEGAMGLILNRRTEVEIKSALGHVGVGSERDETLWIGGPVDGQALWGLHRRGDLRDAGHEVQGGIFSTCNGETVRQILATSPPDLEGSLFRLFVGYAGWSPGQLEAELAEGVWAVVPAGSEVIFSSEPKRLWREMRFRAGLAFFRDGEALRKAALT